MNQQNSLTLLAAGIFMIAGLSGCTTAQPRGLAPGSGSAIFGGEATDTGWKRIKINSKVKGGVYLPQKTVGSDGALFVTGAADLEEDAGFDRVQFAFYRGENSNVGNVRLVSNLRALYIYLEMSEFDRIRDLLTSDGNVYVYWKKPAQGPELGAVWVE